MPKIQYKKIQFSIEKLGVIEMANQIITKYQKSGYNLTLRQLYYQFIAQDLFPKTWADAAGVLNRIENYNKLGDLISDARLAGLIDWSAIVDRGRESYGNRHWESPSAAVASAASFYRTDLWRNQQNYVEVWVEKQALEDILARVCGPLDVRYFACKGYVSQSAMWEASQRLLAQKKDGKNVHIIHLGDHDPSGMDMSRDIFERLTLFVGEKVHVQRIALNMVQVKRYNPPPNPAKVTDSRFAEYQKLYGDESWELDALDPVQLADLITRAVTLQRNEAQWKQDVENMERGRRTLRAIASKFPAIVQFLREARK